MYVPERRKLRVNFGYRVYFPEGPGPTVPEDCYTNDFPPDDRMNIFVLSKDPIRAAEMQCEKHVIKMIVESAQLLGNACHYRKVPGVPTKPTHQSHPCSTWACHSNQNYEWLWEHMVALMWEYTKRYGKVHKYEREKVHEWLWANRPDLVDRGLTAWPLCMPDKYKVLGDPVQSYRNYYIGEKRVFAKWDRLGNMPKWFKEGLKNDADR